MQIARELAASVAHVRDPVMRGEVMNKVSARLSIRVGDFETLVKRGEHNRPVASVSKVGPPVTAPSHDVAMLCLLALRDEEAHAFLLEQNWRDVLAHVPGADLLIRILEADLRPDDPASLNLFQNNSDALRGVACLGLAPAKNTGEPGCGSAWLVEWPATGDFAAGIGGGGEPAAAPKSDHWGNYATSETSP